MPRGRNDYETAQIQGRLWTPAVLRPALWLDAADLSTITIATGVSEWRDKSGNGRNASQATGANQPAYSDFSFRGLPGITFDGTNDHLAFTPWAQASGQDAFVVADTTNIATSNRLFMNRSFSTAEPAFYFGLAFQFNRPTVFWGASSPSGDLGPQASAVQRPAIIRWGLYTGTAFTEVDGGNRSSTSHSQTALSNWTFINSDFGSQQSNVVISEIVIANSPTDAQAAALYGYLSWKWGIRLAADHPFANRPPLIGD